MHVLAPGTQIKAFSWKQTSLKQMLPQTCMDLRYITIGLCKAVPQTNHPTAAVWDSEVHNHYPVVPFQLHITQWFAHSLCYYGDQQVILPLPPTAGMSSQCSHQSVDHTNYHCPKIKETGADWSTPIHGRRFILYTVSPTYGPRRSYHQWMPSPHISHFNTFTHCSLTE